MEEEIRLIAVGLADGETVRAICPKCGGGSDNERTFSVTRTGPGKLGFFCHRATCGYRGVVGASVLGGPARVADKPSRWYTGPYRRPTEDEAAWFSQRFGIQLDERVDARSGRIMYRLMSHDGRTWGYVGRSYDGTKPKALTYWRDNTTPDQLAWCRPSYYRDTKSVVLTEDIVSAKKIRYLGLDAASLLGTHLSDAKMSELLALNVPVFLALDPDRAGQIATARIVRELSPLLDVSVVTLEADPKDMTFDKLGDALVRAKAIERHCFEPAGVQKGGEAT